MIIRNYSRTRKEIYDQVLLLILQFHCQQSLHKLYAIDHITVMSVQPGASGRTFIEDTYTKLELIHAFKSGS